MNARFKPNEIVSIIGNSNEHGFDIGDFVVVCGHHTIWIEEDFGYVIVYRCYKQFEPEKIAIERDYWLVREYDIEK